MALSAALVLISLDFKRSSEKQQDKFYKNANLYNCLDASGLNVNEKALGFSRFYSFFTLFATQRSKEKNLINNKNSQPVQL